jgi:metal-responsive CopG/Arc/MetJ family transcriptional regulator
MSRQPVLHIRTPQPLLDAIDKAGDLQGMNRSATVRELIVEGLKARGLWPPRR